MPLGTGNDLARVLGWIRHTKNSRLRACDVAKLLLKARVSVLDCWTVRLRVAESGHVWRARGKGKGQLLQEKELFLTMRNYASLGFDAEIACVEWAASAHGRRARPCATPERSCCALQVRLRGSPPRHRVE